MLIVVPNLSVRPIDYTDELGLICGITRPWMRFRRPRYRRPRFALSVVRGGGQLTHGGAGSPLGAGEVELRL